MTSPPGDQVDAVDAQRLSDSAQHEVTEADRDSASNVLRRYGLMRNDPQTQHQTIAAMLAFARQQSTRPSDADLREAVAQVLEEDGRPKSADAVRDGSEQIEVNVGQVVRAWSRSV